MERRTHRFAAGDTIAVPRSGHQGRSPGHVGTILEALGSRIDLYRVRWSDGRETVYASGAETIGLRQRSRS